MAIHHSGKTWSGAALNVLTIYTIYTSDGVQSPLSPFTCALPTRQTYTWCTVLLTWLNEHWYFKYCSVAACAVRRRQAIRTANS